MSFSSISPIQRTYNIINSYTYQFFEKSYFVSCLLRFERFVFKNQPARELLIGVTEHELHELHEYVAYERKSLKFLKISEISEIRMEKFNIPHSALKDSITNLSKLAL